MTARWRVRFFRERSELCLQKKIVFCSKKLLFQPFLWTAKNDNGFVSNFSPISNNLLNKLLKRQLEQSCLKIPFSILQFTKKAQKAILWSRIHFFVKFVIFTGKLLSFRILHLAYPKLVGTPCIKLAVYQYLTLIL